MGSPCIKGWIFEFCSYLEKLQKIIQYGGWVFPMRDQGGQAWPPWVQHAAWTWSNFYFAPAASRRTANAFPRPCAEQVKRMYIVYSRKRFFFSTRYNTTTPVRSQWWGKRRHKPLNMVREVHILKHCPKRRVECFCWRNNYKLLKYCCQGAVKLSIVTLSF